MCMYRAIKVSVYPYIRLPPQPETIHQGEFSHKASPAGLSLFYFHRELKNSQQAKGEMTEGFFDSFGRSCR